MFIAKYLELHIIIQAFRTLPAPESPLCVRDLESHTWAFCHITGLILGLHPANERRRYIVTPSLID